MNNNNNNSKEAEITANLAADLDDAARRQAAIEKTVRLAVLLREEYDARTRHGSENTDASKQSWESSVGILIEMIKTDVLANNLVAFGMFYGATVGVEARHAGELMAKIPQAKEFLKPMSFPSDKDIEIIRDCLRLIAESELFLEIFQFGEGFGKGYDPRQVKGAN